MGHPFAIKYTGLRGLPENSIPVGGSWPVSGATITGTVSLDNASYIAVTGGITFLRAEGGKYFYTLAYDADDRPTAAGTARYKLTDGTYTRFVTLRVNTAALTADAQDDIDSIKSTAEETAATLTTLNSALSTLVIDAY